MNKKTKVVATIGPASDKKEILRQLFDAGVNVFRLNFSHGTHEYHGKVIDTIRSLNVNASVMLDTKGPEIRTGEVREKLAVKIGDRFTMTIEKGIYEDTGKLTVNYEDFIKDVNVGDVIVIDGGVLLAKALKKNNKDIEFEVIEGHTNITTKRHVNLLGKPVSLPTVTENDWKDIDFGIEKKVDFIALSFVRSGEDVVKVREYCKNKGVNIQIISKIENYESTQNIEDIVMESDAIMVARGDLACEISFAKVPAMQKKIVSLCSFYNKPVIIATQMLLSMVENIQPTRAEVNDVANAVFEHADAVMTSDETTKGFDPVHVIKVMSRIAKETEDEIFSTSDCSCCDDDCDCGCKEGKECDCSDDACQCGCKDNDDNIGLISILPFITKDVEAIAVVQNDDEYTKSISSARLNLPIFSFTNDEMLSNQMTLIWNTTAVFDKNVCDDFLKNTDLVDKFIKKNNIKKYLLVCDMNSYPTVQIREC